MCQAFEVSFRLESWSQRTKCPCGHGHGEHGPKRTKATASQESFIGANCPNWIPYKSFLVCPCKKCKCEDCVNKRTTDV